MGFTQKMASSRQELIVVGGPAKGSRMVLTTDRPLRIGRVGRGLCLAEDDHVSMEHAEVFWQIDRYMIADLGSHGGTWVNGHRVREPEPLELESLIEVGSSVIRVTRYRPGARWAWNGFAIFVAVAALGVALAFLASRPIAFRPVFELDVPVRQGNLVAREIPIPVPLVRELGLDPHKLSIRQVTDFDRNGIDELWLVWGSRELVYTFDLGGGWVFLGEVPAGCSELAGLTFPDLECGGLEYRYRSGADQMSRYEAVGIDGVVAWVRTALDPGARPEETEPVRHGLFGRAPSGGSDAGPVLLRPYRMGLRREEEMKGFFVSRGITEPVHYLLCEEAISGVRAQVLTESGSLRELSHGCLVDLGGTGPDWSRLFGDGRPEAIAFTVAGRQALLADVRLHLAGDVAGLLMTSEQAEIVDAMDEVAAPSHIGKILARAERVAGRLAAEERILEGARTLIPSRIADGSRPTGTSMILRPGESLRVDPEGCAELEIDTRRWSCSLLRACWPSSSFLTVRQVGCGTDEVLLRIPHAAGRVLGGDAHVEVSVDVEVVSSFGRVDVSRARFAYRPILPSEETEGAAWTSPGTPRRP